MSLLLVCLQQFAPFVSGDALDLRAITGVARPSVIAELEFNGQPGKEFLVFDQSEQAFTVLVPHADKHGPLGTLPGPGLCQEGFFVPRTDASRRQYMIVSILDLNRDGLDDLLLWSPYNAAIPAEPIFGRGAQMCR